MKILLVYPKYPDTFWSFRYALRFISKKASLPPLGLLTVAAMLPKEWEKKLVDLNVRSLGDEDIIWADLVFISAMSIQRSSVREIMDRCHRLDAKIVAGGPLFTAGHEEFDDIDHFVLGEAEANLPNFLDDLQNGTAKHVYSSNKRPDITKTPIPLWSLINMKHYSAMSIQYSRGCPYNCEFCDIVFLNGHKPRTKGRDQVIAELDAISNHGWRGGIFFVDDNFIGNRRKLRLDILPAITDWVSKKRQAFALFTEVSINLADDDELMNMMVSAGFNRVFIGIETMNEESLIECNKLPNKNRDQLQSIRKIQNRGLEVMGGFIVGFDNDPFSIFGKQIEFIQKSGVVTAMVGLLNAPRGTKLYHRLEKENRLLETFTGDNMDCSLNFIPKMGFTALINGYKNILNSIYSYNNYYQRIKTFLQEYKPPRKSLLFQFKFQYVLGLIKSIWILGIKDKGRWHYWKLLVSSLLKYPRTFPLSVTLAVYGFHFRKIVEKINGSLTAIDQLGSAEKMRPLNLDV